MEVFRSGRRMTSPLSKGFGHENSPERWDAVTSIVEPGLYKLGEPVVLGQLNWGGPNGEKMTLYTDGLGRRTNNAQGAKTVTSTNPRNVGTKIEQSAQGAVTSVRLGKTQITDAGQVHLKGLAKLQSLRLIRTMVTDAGIAELQDVLEVAVPPAAGAGPIAGHMWHSYARKISYALL